VSARGLSRTQKAILSESRALGSGGRRLRGSGERAAAKKLQLLGLGALWSRPRYGLVADARFVALEHCDLFPRLRNELAAARGWCAGCSGSYSEGDEVSVLGVDGVMHRLCAAQTVVLRHGRGDA
jgi:hypothetical protein